MTSRSRDGRSNHLATRQGKKNLIEGVSMHRKKYRPISVQANLCQIFLVFVTFLFVQGSFFVIFLSILRKKKSTAECNTIVSAYTMYRNLQEYCTHQTKCTVYGTYFYPIWYLFFILNAL